MTTPIYLDYAATTPVDPRVAQCMIECLLPAGEHGNPSSGHVFGHRARALVEKARVQVAKSIGARPESRAPTASFIPSKWRRACAATLAWCR